LSTLLEFIELDQLTQTFIMELKGLKLTIAISIASGAGFALFG